MAFNLSFKPLSPEEIGNIYSKSKDFLSNTGIKVDHSEALKMLDKAGANVDFDTQQVKLDKETIEAALKTAPRGITLGGNAERYDLAVPHPEGLFYTLINTGANSYLEPETNLRRDATLADMAEWAQLAEVLDEINCCSIITATDTPVETCDIHALKTVFENTGKHVIVQPFSFESVKYLMELAQVVAGSKDSLKERPPISIFACSIPPFVLEGMHVEIIIQAGRLGIPITADSLPSIGGTSPITIAGTVLQASIEIMAIIVMSQLFRPGAPVIARPIIWDIDMATGKTLHCSTEDVLTSAASAQFIKEAFGVPVNSYGFGNDSYIPDGEATLEVMLRGLLVSMAGADILGAAGRMAVISAISPIQLLMDSKLTKILKRVKSGIATDDEHLAWSEIKSMKPGGHYLELAHTLRHCRDAIRPGFLVTEPIDSWKMQGSKDLYQRMLEEYKGLKKKLGPIDFDQEVKRELDRIVKRADEDLVK